MQIIQSKGNIVEKVIRDKAGKLVRAKFFVYENGGRIKARLLNVVYLAEQVLLTGANLLLSSFVSAKSSTFRHWISKSISSPYFSKNSLYFSGSKPRAPTLI